MNFKNKKVLIAISGGLVIIVLVVAFMIFRSGAKQDNGNADRIDQNNSSGQLSPKKLKCQNQYQDLLACNQIDFESCTQIDVRTGDFEQGSVSEKQTNLVMILDASGSMAAQLQGKSKMEIAQQAARNFVTKLSENNKLNLSLVIYGHKGSNSASQKNASCSGIEEVYPLGPINQSEIISEIDSLKATGWTPIGSSLEKAQTILTDYNNDKYNNFILLISDGKETCDNNPVEAMKKLKQSGFNVSINVIGFDVGGQDEAQLKSIAEAGDGDYFSAKNQKDLELILQKHENMIEKMDFKINRTVEQLYDISFIINKYNQCLMNLKKEEGVMMLDINARHMVDPECKDYANSAYNKRYQDIKNKLDANYQAVKKLYQEVTQEDNQEE
ncbi:MAG: VWA domain-containing protein [Candidatus Moranbacteria bacterium]|nr:VWA domain-containing protein [Candidatus Moranbacteria bacterium]